jgi:hypothetical protein
MRGDLDVGRLILVCVAVAPCQPSANWSSLFTTAISNLAADFFFSLSIWSGRLAPSPWPSGFAQAMSVP